MSIEIVQRLDAQQDEVRLPIRVHLTQTLSSSESSERVSFEYTLDSDHDVWFEGPTKVTTRTETISRAETPIEHRVKLVQGEGDEAQRVAIRQTITDSLGTRTPSRISVTVLRGGAA